MLMRFRFRWIGVSPVARPPDDARPVLDRSKTVTSHWRPGVKEGAEFVIPTTR